MVLCLLCYSGGVYLLGILANINNHHWTVWYVNWKLHYFSMMWYFLLNNRIIITMTINKQFFLFQWQITALFLMSFKQTRHLFHGHAVRALKPRTNFVDDEIFFQHCWHIKSGVHILDKISMQNLMLICMQTTLHGYSCRWLSLLGWYYVKIVISIPKWKLEHCSHILYTHLVSLKGIPYSG